MKKRNKVLALVFCFLFMFSTPLFALTALASNVEFSEFEGHISETKVMADLKNMKVENEAGVYESFESLGFPVKFNADGTYEETVQKGVDYMEMIAFYEYGFSKDKGIDDPNYGVYLYVYNPSGRALKEGGRHVANMALTMDASGKATKWGNVSLKLISASEQNMFLKFKIDANANNFPMSIVQNKGLNWRAYSIAGIDLEHGNGSKDYKVGSSVVCTGYREDGTFQSIKGDNLVVDLQCYSTWYRVTTSVNGANKYANLDSVYFSIPARLEEQYGQLTSIEAEWYEYKTNPVLYVKNKNDYKDIYNWFETGNYGKYILSGNHTGDSWRFSEFGSSFECFAECFYTPEIDGDSGLKPIYDAYGNVIDGEQILANLPYVSEDVVDRLGLNAGGVLGDYYDKLDLYTENGLYKGLFTSADEGRTTGYNHMFVNKDDLLTLEPFDGGFFSKFFQYGFDWPKEFGDEESFKAIESLANFNKTMDAASYGINDGDAEKIVNFVDRAEKQDRIPYIYRFAVTDYEFGDVAVLYHSPYGGTIMKSWNGCDVGNEKLFYSRQTVFFNFDILSLGFSKKEGEAVIETRIPVVNDKQDITSDPTTGTETENILVEGVKDVISGTVSVIGVTAKFALGAVKDVTGGVFDVLFGDFADIVKIIFFVIVGIVVLLVVIRFIKFLRDLWGDRKNKTSKK